MYRPQTPGRIEALRLAAGKPANPLMKHIVGLDREPRRQPAAPMPNVSTFESGVDQLTSEERAALPF